MRVLSVVPCVVLFTSLTLAFPDTGRAQRWREMDCGPFLTSSLQLVPDQVVSKSIAVRLDEGPGGVTGGRVFVSFDTDTLRWAGAWVGDGMMDGKNVVFDGAHNSHPTIVGRLLMLNADGPGWADPQTGAFDDRRIRGTDGHAYGPLQRRWAHWRGLYRHGNKVVFAYDVGTSRVLDMPSCRTFDGRVHIVRDLQIGPRTTPLVVRLAADPESRARIETLPNAGMQPVQVAVLRRKDGATAVSTSQSAAADPWTGHHYYEVQRARPFDMESQEFTVVARLRTKQGGTILASAPAGGDWAPNAKALFVRGGRLVFDVGWVGAVQSERPVGDNRWHLVAATYAAQTGNVALYVDGVLTGQRVLHARGKLKKPVIRVGYASPNFPKPQSAFVGQMEFVRFYAKRLSADDLRPDAQLPDDDLIAAWDARAATDARLVDQSTHHRDAQRVSLQPTAPADLAIALSGNRNAELIAAPGGEVHLRVAAGTAPVRLHVVITPLPPGPNQPALSPAAVVADPKTNLDGYLNGGPPLWPTELKTEVASLGGVAGPFAVDDLQLPVDNPWHSWIRPGGLDFFSDPDRAAICSWQGDVWVVAGLAKARGPLRWRRVASGLFQPLGMRIVNDQLFILGRDQITKLHDLNHDGEADFYENYCNDLQVTPHFHEFAMDLQTDANGDFYFMKAARHALPGVIPQHGTLLHVDPVDRHTDIIAGGFRAPDGLLVNSDGTFFSTDQEGHWTPMNRVNWVRPGRFYGNMMAWNADDRNADETDPPVCWIHRETDRSPAAPVRIPENCWGTLGGDIWLLSYGTGKMFRVLTQPVDDKLQGGIVPLPMPEFPTGIQRGRFHTADNQLYVCGLFGWSSDKTQAGGLYRIRYRQQPVKIPDQLAVTRAGIYLHFPVPLEPGSATDRHAYAVGRWNYHRTANYGSKDYRVSDDRPGRDRVAVRAASLSRDRQSVFLHIDAMVPCMQMRVRYQLRDSTATPLSGFVEHTVHGLPDVSAELRQRFPDGLRITPSEPTDNLVLDDLAHGLELHLRSASGASVREDYRAVRTLALLNRAGQIVSSQLSPGPFTASWDGFVHVDLAQEATVFVQFQGTVQVQIGTQTVCAPATSETDQIATARIQLNAGLNQIHVELQSLRDGAAQLRLEWQRPGKVRALVNPTHWYHVPSSAAADHALRREGGLLVRDHNCRQCHAGDTGIRDPMVTRDRPDLTDAARRFRHEWLAAWILDPSRRRDQITMPQTLPNTPAGQQEAADIVAYMAAATAALSDSAATVSSGAETDDTTPPPNLRDGLRLYEDLGCIGCHHFEPADSEDPYLRVSLRFANAKFADGTLQEFLRDPQLHFQWRRMPRFDLTAAEAADLAAYVRQQTKEFVIRSLGLRGDAERGKQAYSTRGCANCHTLSARETEAPAKQSHLADLAASQGCLAARPLAGTVPVYTLTTAQKNAIRAFLRSDQRTIDTYVPAESAGELVEKLRCAVCHRRDGVSPDLPDVIADEGERGLIRRLPPPLTWTGEKLHADWTLKILDGTLGYRTRPWLEARMPAFPAYARQLTEGIAAEHGISTQHEPRRLKKANLVDLGEQLTGKDRGFYCLQCHALPNRLPEAPFESRGIDFVHVRERIRSDYFNRWLRNPPQFDPTTPMPQFSKDGKSTDVKGILDGDAARQFDAIWQFLQYRLETAPAP